MTKASCLALEMHHWLCPTILRVHLTTPTHLCSAYDLTSSSFSIVLTQKNQSSVVQMWCLAQYGKRHGSASTAYLAFCKPQYQVRRVHCQVRSAQVPLDIMCMNYYILWQISHNMVGGNAVVYCGYGQSWCQNMWFPLYQGRGVTDDSAFIRY